jgi:capsid protein
MLRDGDFLFVLVRDKDGNLKIQGIEADRLGDPFKVYTSLDLIGGIHIDRDTGAPSAYDIYNRSIGDFYTYQTTIPSSQAFHLFDPLRIDQYRGISAFHTAINDATDIYDIINFEKMAAKNASSQAGIVKRNNNNASDLSTLTNDEDLNGNTIKLEAIESGKISYLEPGEDIVFPDGPSRPSGAFAEFHKILLRNICLGLGIPYSFAVDPSAMSGPTARLEMQQAGRTFRRYQKLLDDKVLRPIKNIVIADGVARGLIEENVGSRTTRGIFNFGANVSIDLGRESASAISEFKTGLRTAADIYAERGQDFESAMRQRAIEAKLVKDLAGEYEVSADTISDIAMQGLQRETQVQTSQKPTDQPQGQEGDADMLGTASLNGAQVASLINVINAVAMGAVSKEGAVSIITAAFPTISPDQARAIIAGVNVGTTIPTTKEEKQQIAKDQEGDSSGGSTPKKPNPDKPIDGGGKELGLDCGTGAGGFKEGNTCAGGGGGIGSSSRDVTPSGFGPGTSSQEKTKEQRMRGESIDQAINRKVGYQVDNGNVKIAEDKGGWVVSVAQPEGKPRQYRSSNRQQAINQAYTELYPDTELIPHPSDIGEKPQKKSSLEILESLDPASIKMLIEGMMGGIELAKYDGIDFTPPQGARDAAKRALDVREGKPASQRGMTPVGIARARDLQNGVKMSPDTVRRMKAFFDRHEVDKKGATWDEQGKGWQAWNGWGGDAGYAWARKVVGQMEAGDKKTEFVAGRDCGQDEGGTFGPDNKCAVGYGRPPIKGGYTPTRPGGKFPKDYKRPTEQGKEEKSQKPKETPGQRIKRSQEMDELNKNIDNIGGYQVIGKPAIKNAREKSIERLKTIQGMLNSKDIKENSDLIEETRNDLDFWKNELRGTSYKYIADDIDKSLANINNIIKTYN